MIKQENGKNGCFLVFLEKIWYKYRSQQLEFNVGVLHDARDKENKNHDVGAIMRYLKTPETGP